MLNHALQPVDHEDLLGLRSDNDDTRAVGTVEIASDSGWRWSLLLRREQSQGGSANSLGLQVSYGQAPALPEPTVHGDTRPGMPASRLADPFATPLQAR